MGTNILNILMNVILMPLCCTLKVEASLFFVSLVPFHQTTWHHIPEEHTLIMKFCLIVTILNFKISDSYRLLFTDTILNANMDVMFTFLQFTFFQHEL